MSEAHLLAKRVAVVGLGGFGCGTLRRLVARLEGVEHTNLELIGVDTDACSARLLDERGIQIGRDTARGMGTGGDTDLARRSVEEVRPRLLGWFRECEIVILVAGLGGGTGSGTIPVVAAIAREAGAFVIAVVTRPTAFEGLRRQRLAEQSELLLEKEVDSLVWVPTQHLLQAAENSWHGIAGPDRVYLEEVFQSIDNLVLQAVRSLGLK